MNQFESYMPGAWVEDGLIKPVMKVSYEVDRRKTRRGSWSSLQPVIALSICAITASVALLLPSVPYGVADVDIVASSTTTESSRRGIETVPDGYWDRLGAAITSVSRLPAQDASFDPPIMV